MHESQVRLHVPLPPETKLQAPTPYRAKGAGLDGADVEIAPTYYFEQSDTDRMTKPLGAFELTTITGLTQQPIELRGYFSQTLNPSHHNFDEEFIFEPRLDPSLTDAQRADLERMNVVRIYVDEADGIHVLGKEGNWRRLLPTDRDARSPA